MDSNNLFVKVSIQDLIKIGIERDIINKLVNQYEFGERSIYDLYAKPLLVTVRDALEILITWGRGGSIKALLYYLVEQEKYTKESLAHIFEVNLNLLNNLDERDPKRKDFIINESETLAVIGEGSSDCTVSCNRDTFNSTLVTQGEYTSITRADGNGLTIIGKKATCSRVLNVGSPNSIVSIGNQSTIVLDSGGLRSIVISMGSEDRVVSTFGGNDDVFLYGDYSVYTNTPSGGDVKVTGAHVEVRGENCKLNLDIPVKEVYCEKRTAVIVHGTQVYLQPGTQYVYDVESSKYLLKKS